MLSRVLAAVCLLLFLSTESLARPECIGCGQWQQASPSCIGCGRAPASFNNGGPLDLQPAPAPSGLGGTIVARGSGSVQSGKGPAGETLDNILLIPGQRVAARSGKVFREVILNEGHVGFLSGNEWKEFPKASADQVLKLIQANPKLAALARGSDGPIPLSVTIQSNVDRLQFGNAGGKSLDHILLDPGQPIKGKGADGSFRPIQVREDGRIGFWDPRGWSDFPAKTKEQLQQFMAGAGRSNEEGARRLNGTPERAEPREESTERTPSNPPPAEDHGPSEEPPAPESRAAPSSESSLDALKPGTVKQILGTWITSPKEGQYVLCSPSHGACEQLEGKEAATEALKRWSETPSGDEDQRLRSYQMETFLNAVADQEADEYPVDEWAARLREGAANPDKLTDTVEQLIDVEEAFSTRLGTLMNSITALDDDTRRILTALAYNRRPALIADKIGKIAKKIEEGNTGTPKDPRLKAVVSMLTGEKGYVASFPSVYSSGTAEALNRAQAFNGPGCPACGHAAVLHNELSKAAFLDKYRGRGGKMVSNGPITLGQHRSFATFFGSDGSLMIREGLDGDPKVVDVKDPVQADVLKAAEKHYSSHQNDFEGEDRARVDRFLRWSSGQLGERAPAQQREEPQPEVRTPVKAPDPQPERQVTIHVYGNLEGIETARGLATCPFCVSFESALNRVKARLPKGTRIVHHEANRGTSDPNFKLGTWPVILLYDGKNVKKAGNGASAAAIADQLPDMVQEMLR